MACKFKYKDISENNDVFKNTTIHFCGNIPTLSGVYFYQSSKFTVCCTKCMNAINNKILKSNFREYWVLHYEPETLLIFKSPALKWMKNCFWCKIFCNNILLNTNKIALVPILSQQK